MIVRPLEGAFAPYASANSVLGVIHRFRERGLPDPLTSAALEQVGVKPSMTSFTLRALVFLGLIDEGGNISPAFNRLRQASASTGDYTTVLAEIIRKAYLKAFTVADPSVDGEDNITDAFRIYEPANQRTKMISLFMGLCQEAGIVAAGSVRKRRPMTPTPSRSQRIRPNEDGEHDETLPPAPIPLEGKLHLSLLGLINDLPKKGVNWTKTDRDRWMTAFTHGLDYAYPTKDELSSRSQMAS